ncbi:integrase, catalytic region, zinc finger, CCHC-type containing protein [Tanacetum coccineum]
MMLDSIDAGPLVYPTVVGEDGQTRPKKYSELTEAQQLQDDYDVQATNIILHGLPPNVYALVNHQEATKDIWDRVKLLMKGTELSYQERECRLYNLFDKFAFIQGETLYEYYWRFSQLINDKHTIGMAMQQVKPITTEFPQLDSGLVVPTFQQGEDPIDYFNKSMAFLFAVASRQTQSFVGTGNKGIATTSRGNYAAGQEKVVKCYNCLGEGHMPKQCTQPKRPRSSAWFKKKVICLSEVPYYDTYLNDMIYQDVHEMSYSEQTHIVDCPDIEITKQAFCLKHSNYNPDTSVKSHTPIRIEAPSELPKFVQIVLWYLDSGCSKNMTGNRSQLINFVSKFLGIVRFGNDHIAKIMGYGDYQMGNVTISQVYYVEGLGHNLFSMGQFCDSDLEVAFRKHTCFIRDLEGVDLLKGSRGSNLYTLSMENLLLFSPICLLSKASKTKKPDLSYLHIFGALCYPTNDIEDLGKLKPKADIGIFVGYAPAKKAFLIYNKKTRLNIETIHVDFDELTTMAS